METVTASGARLCVYRDASSFEALTTAAVGGFQCEDADSGAALLDVVAKRLALEGVEALVGPMDGDTWHRYRLVTQSDGSPPFLMEPSSAAHDVMAFEAAGFDRIGKYFSARMALERMDLSPLPDPEAFRIEAWNGSDPRRLFAEVHDLSLQAFAGNVFYKPISRDAFLEIYLPFVAMLEAALIFFARANDGALAGFLFGMPNHLEGPSPHSAILKTYASLHPVQAII